MIVQNEGSKKCGQTYFTDLCLFKASALWADAFYKSICPSVRLCVCLVTFEVPFNGLLPPLHEVGCPIFLEIRNPWGKIIERSGLTFEHFRFEVVSNRRAKKSFFLLILPWSTLLWHRCYYPHRWRDALSPVCGIFFKVLWDTWRVTCDTWHIIHNTWHLAHDMWHIVWGEHSLKM